MHALQTAEVLAEVLQAGKGQTHYHLREKMRGEAGETAEAHVLRVETSEDACSSVKR